MKTALPSTLCLIALLPGSGLVGRVAAQSPTPAAARPAGQRGGVSDLYLQGYLTMTAGDKLRDEGRFAAAFFKYREARDTFDAVHATDASWNPEVVEYRRRKIREDMESVRQREIQRRAAGGAPSADGVVGSGENEDAAFSSATPPAETPRAPVTGNVIMEERIKALNLQMQRLEQKNEDIFKALGAKEEELRRTRAELLDSRSSEKELRERLADVRTKLDTADAAEKRRHKELLAKIDSLQQTLDDTTAKLVAANQRTETMAAELSKAYTEIRSLTTERDTLRKERDQLNALLAGDDVKGPARAKIIEENQRLRRELAEAQSKITQLGSEKEKDRAEITALKDQVKSVQESLAAIQQENEEYRQQIASLTSRLDATAKRLADSAEAGALPEQDAVAENSVLREIILQQLKQQARRERARQNLMDELTREGVFDRLKELGVESDKMLRAVNEMAAPVTLSREQREIITSTQVSKLMTSADGKELFLVEDSGTPPEPAPGELPPANGARDRAGLSPELKACAVAAEELFRQGSYDEAENNFRKILTVEPQNVYALCNLGVTLLRQMKLEEASETLRKAQAYDFDNDFSHYLLGVAYLRQGRLDDAATEIHTGLKLNPSHAAAWHTLGLIVLKQGKRDTARNYFEKAVAADPNCAEAHFNLAVIHATSDPPRLDLARRHYRDAVRAGAARDAGLDKLLGST